MQRRTWAPQASRHIFLPTRLFPAIFAPATRFPASLSLPARLFLVTVKCFPLKIKSYMYAILLSFKSKVRFTCILQLTHKLTSQTPLKTSQIKNLSSTRVFLVRFFLPKEFLNNVNVLLRRYEMMPARTKSG